jgi:lipopolysaccharide biosynthesis glycosyltransferase
MKKTPIVFSFNDTYTMPAGVCITSLLENSNDDTFYDIFVMHSSDRLSESNKARILALKTLYPRFDITFVDVKNQFDNAFEIRNISVDAYFRLAIPDKILHYDQIIYCDIDVIITADLSHLNSFDFKGKSLGAVRITTDDVILTKSITSISLDPGTYFNSGFLLMNLKKIREENSTAKKLYPLISKQFIYQDQDMLNIAYQDDVEFISERYNYSFNRLREKIIQEPPIVYHFTGKKPWNVIRSFGDVWWEYYRKSVFFDQNFYLQFQQKHFNNLSDQDQIMNFLKRFGIYQLLKKFIKY